MPPMIPMPAELTVVVHRRIRHGREAEFEVAMRDFVRLAMDAPGHRGITILAPAAGERDYLIVDRWHDEPSRRAFTGSAEYLGWMRRVGELTDGPPRIEELTGLEGWFRGEGPHHAMPPRWKMAIATFIGVCPTASALSLTIGPTVRSWPFIVGQIAFNACVVGLLTWFVMPFVTRVLKPWLVPPSRNARGESNS